MNCIFAIYLLDIGNFEDKLRFYRSLVFMRGGDHRERYEESPYYTLTCRLFGVSYFSSVIFKLRDRDVVHYVGSCKMLPSVFYTLGDISAPRRHEFIPGECKP